MESNIRESFCPNSKCVEGNVGIEIEMETTQPVEQWEFCGNVWRDEEDHSLKKNGRELVLKNPLNFEDVGYELEKLKEGMFYEGIEIVESIRAGVHIHLNMQKDTVQDVKNLMSCYYPIESILTRFCGEGREGNVFCMRVRDTPFMGIMYHKFFGGSGIYTLLTDNLRYSAFNLQPLWKYGTIEFRAFSTPTDVTMIAVWARMIEKLYKHSKTVSSTTEALEVIQNKGVKGYLKDVFGDELAELLYYEGMAMDSAIDTAESKIFLEVGCGLH